MNISDLIETDTFVKTPIGHLYEFYLSGNIEAPEQYINWFDVIRKASEQDVIKIYINSDGGNLYTAIQFARSLKETKAYVMVSIEGSCMSAATIIMLCADSYEVAEHSVFMFHNYSGGTSGKGGEMYDNIIYERRWSENFLYDIYRSFLTEREIQSMLDNKDLWMTSEEVIERLQNMLKEKEVEDVVEDEWDGDSEADIENEELT